MNEVAFSNRSLLSVSVLFGCVVTAYVNLRSYQPSHCQGSLCLQCCNCDNSGTCRGDCKDGYHGLRCYNACPDNCSKCKDHSDAVNYGGYAYCTSCKDGYYATEELYQCQLPCPTGCLSCTSNATCSVCKEGYYGIDCSLFCPENCLNRECNKKTRNCHSCNGSFDGLKCDNCIPGMYGQRCDINCPNRCIRQVCERSTGRCSQGCIPNFAGPDCSECQEGFYGQLCTLPCPLGCKKNCSRISGVCHECSETFTGKSCEYCVQGFYGSTCSLPCSNNCLDGMCFQGEGECLSCVSPDHYGLYCEHKCPKYCINNTCDRLTGVCTDGCNSSANVDAEKICPSSLLETQPEVDEGLSAVAVSGIIAWSILIVVGVIGLAAFCYKRYLDRKRAHLDKNPIDASPNVTEMEVVETGHYESLPATRDSGSTYTTLR